MKTMSFVFLLVASITFVFVLGGCTDNFVVPASSADEALMSPGSSTRLAKYGVKHSVTGSAHTYNITQWNEYFQTYVIVPGPKEKGGFYNVFTVHAMEMDDGTFSGSFISQFQGKVPPDQAFGFAAKVEGKVIQLMVDETGTMAKVVGEITKIDGYSLPLWFVIVFVDHGEGSAPENRDHVSSWWFDSDPTLRDLWLSQTPQEYVDWEWNILKDFLPDLGATIPIDNGNIQVW